MVQRLPTLLLLASTPASADWAKGGFATLTFDTSDPGAVTYRLAYASSTGGAPIALPSNALATVGPATTSSGTDALGAYEALTLPVAGGALAVAYYAADDAFVWTRSPANDSLQTTWPSFDEAEVPAASRCLYWGEHFFFPGGEPGCDGPQDGPQVLFEPPSNSSIPSAALVVAPLDHFTTTFAVHCAAPGSARRGAQDAKLAGLDAAPCPAAADGVGVDASAAPGAANAAVTLARPGVTAALRAFGATTRRFHNGTKRRGEGVEGLAYWNDNQAGYSWWTVGDDQTVFGNPEAIYEKLKDGYEAAGVRVRSWEPDNNFNVSYFDPKNWKGLDLKQFNETLYPSGGAGFLEKMSKARPEEPVAMTFYTNGFTPDCARQDDWRMVKSNGGLEPNPNESFAFHADLLKYQRDAFGLEMLFTDFLCYRGPGMAAYGDVPAGEDGEHLWLAGIAEAAASLGVEVQFCMALAHQIMATVEWPAVTNARVNGDGGLAVQDLPLPAALAGALGLGWSKDNLRTADRCYVNATAADGSLKYDCAKDLNKGERVSGSFANQRQQTVHGEHRSFVDAWRASRWPGGPATSRPTSPAGTRRTGRPACACSSSTRRPATRKDRRGSRSRRGGTRSSRPCCGPGPAAATASRIRSGAPSTRSARPFTSTSPCGASRCGAPCRNQPLVWVVLTKLENSLARSNQSRFG